MAYLGYKNKFFREYKREQERVKIWHIKQKAEKARRRKRLREWKNLYKATLAHVVIAIMLIALYSLVYVTSAKADTKKFGEGPFVMAISFTDYKNLQYVGNFPTCIEAEQYFHANCASATIMMCQAEARMYMPITHNPENTFSSFDFEVNDSQSCGFVKTQAGYSTFVEEN